MSWYYGTYSCGHDGRINIVGPQKDRQAKADYYFSGLCPECLEKERKAAQEKANEYALEKSSKMEWPALTGSEKQVAWANTLRLASYEKYDTYIHKADDSKLKSIKLKIKGEIVIISTSKEELSIALDYAVQIHTDAIFWIENRDNNTLFFELFKEYLNHKKDEENIPSDVKEEIKEQEENATAVPEGGSLKNGVVKVKFRDDRVSAEYIKNTDFMSIVKGLGYKWDGQSWKKKITEYTGVMEERIAELGNILLKNGFTVQFPNADIKSRAISGNFLPENDRWVKFNSETNQLSLVWSKRSDVLYENAKKLPGARWKDGSMRVNLEFYREVEDFADTMGFSISQTARCKIDKYKQKESEFETVSVAAPNINIAEDKARIAAALKSGGTIIEDLLDE